MDNAGVVHPRQETPRAAARRCRTRACRRASNRGNSSSRNAVSGWASGTVRVSRYDPSGDSPTASGSKVGTPRAAASRVRSASDFALLARSSERARERASAG